jgi:hypothetical protein
MAGAEVGGIAVSADEGMRVTLPKASAAVISQAKIVDYLLNPLHPDGAGKAQFFTGLGFDRSDWQRLASALRRLAETTPVARSMESQHGMKYIIEGALGTPNGRFVQVRTVWIVDGGDDVPRFVTAYPCDRGS